MMIAINGKVSLAGKKEKGAMLEPVCLLLWFIARHSIIMTDRQEQQSITIAITAYFFYCIDCYMREM